MPDVWGTGDVAIYNEDGTKPVSVITDGAVERLAVDISGTINGVASFVTNEPVIVCDEDDASSGLPYTHAEYTVPTGKIFYLTGWQGHSYEGAIFKIELQVNGTTKDIIGAADSEQSAVRQNNQVNYSPFGIIKATAGQVVRIRQTSGDTGKKLITTLWGFLVDA